MSTRVVAHIDMDAFYAQVEQGLYPSLRGQPVAVVQYPSMRRDLPDLRSEDYRIVTSSNSSLIAVSYEARPFGVKRGMRAAEAQAVCPTLTLVQVPTRNMKADISHYREMGAKVVEVLAEACGGLNAVEKASIDEVYVEVTAAAKSLLHGVETHIQGGPHLEQGEGEGEEDLEERSEPGDALPSVRWLQGATGAGEGGKSSAGAVNEGSMVSEWDKIAEGGWKAVVEAARGTKVAGVSEPTASTSSVHGAGDGGSNREGGAVGEGVRVGGGEREGKGDEGWWSRPLHEWGQEEMLLACGTVVVCALRRRVRARLGYTCSAGVAHNKLLAKVGSSMNKPNGQTVLPEANVPALLGALPVHKVCGWGGKLGDRLKAELGAATAGRAGDVAAFSLQQLQRRFGEQGGRQVWERSHGVDKEPVKAGSAPKSIGCSKTFPGRSMIRSEGEARHWLTELAKEMCERLLSHQEEEGQVAKTFAVGFSIAGQPKGVSRSCPLRKLEVAYVAETGMSLIKAFMEKEGGTSSFVPISNLSVSSHGFQDNPKNVPRITSFFRATPNQLQATSSSSPSLSPPSTSTTGAEGTRRIEVEESGLALSSTSPVRVRSSQGLGLWLGPGEPPPPKEARKKGTSPSKAGKTLAVHLSAGDCYAGGGFEAMLGGRERVGGTRAGHGAGHQNEAGACAGASAGAGAGAGGRGGTQGTIGPAGHSCSAMRGKGKGETTFEPSDLTTHPPGTRGLDGGGGVGGAGGGACTRVSAMPRTAGTRGRCGGGNEQGSSPLVSSPSVPPVRSQGIDQGEECWGTGQGEACCTEGEGMFWSREGEEKDWVGVGVGDQASTSTSGDTSGIASPAFADRAREDHQEGRAGKGPEGNPFDGLKPPDSPAPAGGMQSCAGGTGQEQGNGRQIAFGRGGASGAFGDVDPEVLAALPKEIQREVWMHQGGQQQAHSQGTRKRPHPPERTPGRGRGRGRGRGKGSSWGGSGRKGGSKHGLGQGQQGSIDSFLRRS